MPRKLISEEDVARAAKGGLRVLPVDADTIITPSARDAAQRTGIAFEQVVTGQTGSHGVGNVTVHLPEKKKSAEPAEMIALGSDHGGFGMKEMLKPFLLEIGYAVADVGTHQDAPCDYPDFAYAVARLVADGQASKGIMIDGVGVASAMVANKVPGVRAAACADEFVARSSREHNDANLLTLGGRVIGPEKAKAIVRVWLETWFGGGRHQGRLKKIVDIERRMLR